MKHLRIWLLLLLAVLLPVRGAMAAAMLCLPQGGAQSDMVVAEHHGAGMASALHDHSQHAHHDAGAAQQQEEGSASVTSDDCNLCASFCSLTPLASAALELRHPQAQAALNPAPSVLAPSFVSDGEKRPPRTI